jgi:hypothetical protein
MRDQALEIIERHRTLTSQAVTSESRKILDLKAVDRLTEVFRAPLLAAEPPSLERVGLGYRATFESAGVEMTLTRVRQAHGEVYGELNVELRQDPTGFGDGQLLASRFNLSSLTSRTSTAKYLDGRLKGDWAGLLERFCNRVLRMEREGQPFEKAGRDPRSTEQRYLMRPLLPLEAATIIFGAAGSGKSTLATAVAVAIATGREVIPGWEPTPGPVLFLDWEAHRTTLNDRVAALALGVGAVAPEIHYRRMNRPLADDVEAVADFINAEGILLVVVDSLGLAMGGGREGEAVADSTFRLFDALRVLEITSLLIDHVAGADLENARPTAKPYGSVYKQNLARLAFELKQEGQATRERIEIALLNNKANDDFKLPAQGLAICRDDRAIRIERTDIEAPELVATLSLPERMARLLRDGAQTRQVIVGELATSDSNVRSVLARDKGRRFARLADGRVGLASHAT